MLTGSANFDGPLSLDYRRSPQGRAGSNPAPAARWLGFQLASCPSLVLFGPNVVGYLAKWKSTGLLSRSCRFDSCDPTQSLARIFCFVLTLSTGRRIGLSPHK